VARPFIRLRTESPKISRFFDRVNNSVLINSFVSELAMSRSTCECHRFARAIKSDNKPNEK